MRNPFRPAFGTTPPLLVGREELLHEFITGIEEGPGSPSRATIYTGSPGIGKTVMLNQVGLKAKELGWIVIDETATPGFMHRLDKDSVPGWLKQFDDNSLQRVIKGLNGPGNLGVEWDTTEKYIQELTLRTKLSLLAALLAENLSGVLITLDEVHYSEKEELRSFTTMMQHMFREEQEIAFAAAGLPASISTLLDDDLLTFLRRADKKTLQAIPTSEIEEALRIPIEAHQRDIDDKACKYAVKESEGFPYMIQLIGYHSWKQQPENKIITLDDVKQGVVIAAEKMGDAVHEKVIRGLPQEAVKYLLSMSSDDNFSRVADINSRLGKTKEYSNVYRSRLIDAGVIEPSGHGLVRFVVPALREYLRKHQDEIMEKYRV